jgi:hypothetical protein
MTTRKRMSHDLSWSWLEWFVDHDQEKSTYILKALVTNYSVKQT